MPCWEVNLVSVEFKVRNIEVLKVALTQMGMDPVVWGNGSSVSVQGLLFDLDNEKVQVSSGYINKLAEVKRQYAMVVVEEVARKKRWVVKNKGKNKLELRRY